jgi:CubicO group peptidase (beta-lactamase class C family)
VSLWSPFFPERSTTLAHLLAHVTPAGNYKYDLARFSALTSVVEACSGLPYQQLLAEEIFSWLSLEDSVPGSALVAPTLNDVQLFGVNNLARYAVLMSQSARGYRVDPRGRVTRTDVPLSRVNAATGVVTTARDLARFDAAFRFNLVAKPESVALAWSPVSFGFPSGFGWLVQPYNGHTVVWQFGVVADAYSALVVKVPVRGLTLILLANSDALAAHGALEKGDVTASVFARAFLRTYLP